MLPLIFPQNLTLQTGTYIKWHDEVVLPSVNRVAVGSSLIWQFATHTGESTHDSNIISPTTSSLTPWQLTPQTATPLMIMCRSQLSERLTKLLVKSKMNLRQELWEHSSLKQGDNPKELQGSPKSVWGRCWSPWRFYWIILI